jgi:acyl carrier protein
VAAGTDLAAGTDPTANTRPTEKEEFMRQVTADRAIGFLYEISGHPEISPQTQFGELGLDSLGVIEWITNIEDELEADLEVRKIDFRDFDDKSIATVLDIIHQHVMEN